MIQQLTRARRDGIVIALTGIAVYGLFLQFDVFDALVDFARTHEAYQLDEIILAVFLCGLLSFLYSWRRVVDLTDEIRARNKAEDQATWFAYHDPLTRLPNRSFIEARLKDGRWRVPDPRSVYAIDLDGFKKVNDLVGHHGGDQLLVTLAKRMIEKLPEADIVRLGGDEFVVIASAEGDEAERLGHRIVELLSTPVVISGMQVDVGASVGRAELKKCGMDIEEALRCADLAMYAAKRRGRNSVCLYDVSLQTALSERLEIEKAMRAAIADDVIRPHYQPLIDMNTGEVRGFEALARWTREDGTSVPPDVFIGIAEEAGLITDLSGRLLRQACLDAANWPAPIYLAFNISPMQLTDRLLGLRIVRILNETGMAPQRLEIEVTESAVVREMETAMGVIDVLRKAGIKVALDDFGTGFSSLSQLAHIPFDRIKIDRSFVNSFEESAKQTKIVKSIVGLGLGLGVEMTAEGIEKHSQFEHLKDLGCEMGQGFLFGKAMPPAEVAGFLAARAGNPVARIA